MRISLFGGGTDVPWFYETNNGGATLSLAIDKYVTLVGAENFDQCTYHLKYSNLEKVESKALIKHPIIREVANLFNLQSMDLAIYADFPSGTGMGSSSSFTCAMIQFAAQIKGTTLTSQEIAELACKVEIEILGEPIGKQDQYASAYGGVNLFEFTSTETKVNPVPLTPMLSKAIESSLLLVYLGLPNRSAGEHLKAARLAAEKDSRVEDSLAQLKDLAYFAYKAIPEDPDSIGRLLEKAWELKKSSHPSDSNEKIDVLVKLGLTNGATGGKLLGAGGSGFVVFWVPENRKENFLDAMRIANLRVIDFEISSTGTRSEWID